LFHRISKQGLILYAPMQISMAPDRIVLEYGGTEKALMSEAPSHSREKTKKGK